MLQLIDAGTVGYRDAWDLQLRLHDAVMAGTYPGGVLMLVEHPAVITVGRRAEAQKHLLVPPESLPGRGVELVETDRGGDITFHGPGQLVAYPIIHLNAYNLNLHGYMRLLETVVMETVGVYGIEATRVEGSTGVWVNPESAKLPMMEGGEGAAECTCASHPYAKICAIGVKLRRWTTLHGLALNVTTDMSYFELINPCGLSKPVTSMQRLLGEETPAIGEVKRTLAECFNQELQVLFQSRSGV